uniref:Uncharacterized protein n=1 Tax=Avena sativa TaxID=4498 RepID=A0ACD5X6Q6_AVESA
MAGKRGAREMVGKKAGREVGKAEALKTHRGRGSETKIEPNPGIHSSEEGSDQCIEFTRPPPVPGADARNYAFIDLDEPEKARVTWRSAIQQFRLWSYNTTSDRYCFGHERRRNCMLPEDGHFLIYMQYHKKWLCAVIDGSTGYLNGYITRSSGQDIKVQENSGKASASDKGKKTVSSKQIKERPLQGDYIEGAIKLPWPGSYVNAKECELGYNPFVNSFSTMRKRIEGTQPAPDKSEVVVAGNTMILLLPESGRSDRLRRKADRNFFRGIKVGKDIAEEAINWSGRTLKAFAKMRDVTPNKWQAKKRGWAGMQEPHCMSDKCFGTGLTEQMEIIEDLRLFYRVKPLNPKFYLADMPIHLNWQGPVGDGFDILTKRGCEVNELSEFLTQPFLQFNRSEPANKAPEDEKADQIPDSGVSPKHQASHDKVESPMTFRKEKEHPFTELQRHSDGFEKNMIEKVTQEVETLDFTGLDSAYKDLHNVIPYEPQMVSQGQTKEDHGSAGIYNIGNTCYANSALQYLHCVPDLKVVLDRCIDGGSSQLVDPESHHLISALRDVLQLIDNSDVPINPQTFVEALRKRFPQFREKERDGTTYRQQDVAECLTLLLPMLSDNFGIEASGSAPNPIGNLFGIQRMNRTRYTKEVVYNLDCSIDEGIGHLQLQKGLELALDRADARLTRLPTYLTIQFQRVSDDGKSDKILRKVDYPVELDVYDLCSEELKKVLKINKEGSLTGGQSSTVDVDHAKTGTFDLIAVVTHEGETTNCGHYVILAKQEDCRWIQFDDTEKSLWKEEDVLNLSGGGELFS